MESVVEDKPSAQVRRRRARKDAAPAVSASDGEAPVSKPKRKPVSRKWTKPWPTPESVGTRSVAPSAPAAATTSNAPVAEALSAAPLPDFPDAVWLLPLCFDAGRRRPAAVEEGGDDPGDPEAGAFEQASLDQIIADYFEWRPQLRPADRSPVDARTMEQLHRLADESAGDLDTPISEPWSEEEIVYLHWRLLRSITSLADPRASLLEKLSVLRWVFTDDPDCDSKPFSFMQCLRVVGCSPLTNVRGLPYVGEVDVEEVRDMLQARLRRQWMLGAFDRYPLWLREDIATKPDYYMNRLEKDPQWLAKKLKGMQQQRDTGQRSLFDLTGFHIES